MSNHTIFDLFGLAMRIDHPDHRVNFQYFSESNCFVFWVFSRHDDQPIIETIHVRIDDNDNSYYLTIDEAYEKLKEYLPLMN